MYLRTILFSMFVLLCASTTLAQRPGPEFWRKVGCEPLEPRTKLEAIEDRHSTVVIKGFTRITLQPGERRTVTFSLNADNLAFYDAAGRRVTEPGFFKVFVGTSSASVREARFELVGAER